MTKQIMNWQNDGFKNGYKAFLGEPLGFADTINVSHKVIKDFQLELRANDWTEKEVDLSRDANDLASMGIEKDIILLNLITQWALDSIACRNVYTLLEPFISSSEVVSYLLAHARSEDVHELQYSEIVRVGYNNPISVIEEARNNVKLIYRTQLIANIFQEAKIVGNKLNLGMLEKDDPYVIKTLFKTLAAIFGMEAISFVVSFSATFSITKNGKAKGIDNAVGLIYRDELLHANAILALLKIAIRENGEHLWNEVLPEIQEMMDAFVEQEDNFAEYLYQDGRTINGNNATMAKRYVRYVAKPVYDKLGLVWIHETVERNPYPFMTGYEKPSTRANANQENENTNYRVSTLVSDYKETYQY